MHIHSRCEICALHEFSFHFNETFHLYSQTFPWKPSWDQQGSGKIPSKLVIDFPVTASLLQCHMTKL